MNDLETFQAVIARITEVRKTKAVATKGGKRYTQVQDRVEAFRHHFGAAFGLETDIDCKGFAKGDAVVARCVIRDPTNRIVATGHAVEFWGASPVNSTSALENAETSAIGRALAALGIHGGEFASINEIEGVDRKADAMTDDQTTVVHVPGHRAAPAGNNAATPAPLLASKEVEDIAKSKEFARFVRTIGPDAATVREYVCEWCRVGGLSELDSNKDAQARWGVLLKQFHDWQGRGMAA
jgi:hypothetical protein